MASFIYDISEPISLNKHRRHKYKTSRLHVGHYSIKPKTLVLNFRSAAVFFTSTDDKAPQKSFTATCWTGGGIGCKKRIVIESVLIVLFKNSLIHETECCFYDLIIIC